MLAGLWGTDCFRVAHYSDGWPSVACRGLPVPTASGCCPARQPGVVELPSPYESLALSRWSLCAGDPQRRKQHLGGELLDYRLDIRV